MRQPHRIGVAGKHDGSDADCLVGGRRGAEIPLEGGAGKPLSGGNGAAEIQHLLERGLADGFQWRVLPGISLWHLLFVEAVDFVRYDDCFYPVGGKGARTGVAIDRFCTGTDSGAGIRRTDDGTGGWW